ncbi:MAG: selenocysteine-specific translation elongation factor [Candidatus Marinimicrobia bacterium]|nr:selenocysteine-specific translation elongation factor [Candidatus Neomarinimicrobiota bacterium]|tara:strand:- start:502 stop:2400 length:1899 start_codon:yes stop_codon:yes gene_type:complete
MSIDNQVVVGMSGHIDHGKTSLVQALTGKNTDSLDQEKLRGMTIDIGFAYLEDKVTIIDVPGHEKFVKNMLSGSTGIDIAVLVIAADDGVMPQTKEHFEILKLLNIKNGFVVLNKVDLVENDWIELVKKDILDLTDSSFMHNTKIIETSVIEKIGIDDVKHQIIEMGSTIPSKENTGLFRMHIDRTFSKTGFGTVVTGTVSSGSVSVGETVEILPGNQQSKIRNIQTHGRDVDKTNIGERAAINLNNISSADLSRGYHLSKPKTYQQNNSFIAEISIIDKNKYSIKSNQRVRVHLGTKEVMARISIIKNNIESDQNKVMALFKLENSLVCGIGDRFIIRQYSPVVTIAGGIIHDITRDKVWKEIKKLALDFIGKNRYERLYSIVSAIPSKKPLEYRNIENYLNMSKIEFDSILSNDDRYEIIEHNKISWVVTKANTKLLIESIKKFISDYHTQNPMIEGCNKKVIGQKIKIEENFLTFLLEKMKNNKIIKSNLNFWSMYNFSLGLKDKDLKYKDQILSHLKENDFIDISNNDFFIKNNINKDVFYGIVNYLESKNEIVKIDSNIFVSLNKIKLMKKLISDFFKVNESLSVPEFKEMTNLTRKYAIPVLEYFDKINYTYRIDNRRKLSEVLNV